MSKTEESPTNAATTSQQQVVTAAVLRDLRELFESEFGGRDPFPGAVGRVGSWLVKLGLARRLGRHTYNSGSYGERPDEWTRFECTEKGKQVIATHGRSR
jgi:predicted component of type VI protein secretion system